MLNKFKSFRRSLAGRNSWLLFFAIAFMLLGINIVLDRKSDLSEYVAVRLNRVVNRRFSMLESYMKSAMEQSRDSWMELDGVPEDMVIYRYCRDSLQSWCNQFSVDNDDIGHKLVVQRFASLRYNFVSPLAEADETVKYLSIGPKWYLVRAVSDADGWKVIGGLEVKNTMDTRSINGVNPRFRLSDRFSLQPISYSGGSVLNVDGRPIMKIIQETVRVVPFLPDSTMLWISVFMLVAGIMLILYFNKSLKALALSLFSVSLVMGGFCLVGYGLQNSSTLFSPTVYADGPVMYSLGSLLIVNTWLTVMFFCVFIGRGQILDYVLDDRTHRRSAVLIILAVCGVVMTVTYVILTFRSLILNSNVSLELYKISSLSRFTLYVYLSYLALLSVIPLAFQMVRVPVYTLSGWKYDVFSRTGRSIFSVLAALSLLALLSVLGADKENNRVEIWMNRLAIDRDLGLELQLRGVENAIASDNSLAGAVKTTDDYRVLLNRITESYMNRISKDYDVSLYVFKDNFQDPQMLKYFNDRVVGAVPIAAGSRFVYSRNVNGRAQYTGMFVYYSPDSGVTKLLLGVNSKSEKEERGYSFILDSGAPDAVVIPPQYSYAKYINGKLVSYKGDYPYPTVLTGKFKEESRNLASSRTVMGNYVHFFCHLSPDECIVISRFKITVLQYVVCACMILLCAYFWISLLGIHGKKNKGAFEKNYYKSRVNTVLFLSMLMTLVTMSLIMVVFVYKRNDVNIMRLMTNKISTMQSLIENRVRSLESYRDMTAQNMSAVVNDVGSYTESDITMYSPGGKVFCTTAPEVFERMILGSRANPEAYKNIMYSNKRYYIHREKVGGVKFYTMYAPVFNDSGTLLAIISSPYTDSGLSFRNDAIFHSVFVVAVFFILLIITRFMTTKVVDKMFRPIIEMGRKMIYARTGGLEYIIYDNEDEISGLVRAYNLMVHDLSESGKQLAQAERERAWSEMARQVAHEIKNPLTPIKLQIQRLIRLKGRNDPSWESKFDDISRLVLDSIDVLTDTANEFSTFAKLYTEELVPINLDEMATDQISMFDDRDNISFQYYGLKDAWVMGPKPQLVRVFVNLLTNAVQAIENQQAEDEEAGRQPVHGQIVLSLRNSTKESFYDIVFEDSGPGIKDENRSRLFTPNFTTKSSGTGLGLAICKNILERCGGEIQYSQSFSLKGACFTVRFPKAKHSDITSRA